MRNLKTTDGLTRGSGMNESPRLVWLLSTPACRGDPGGFGHCQFFFLFLILCSCDKAHLLPKERDWLCLWIVICVFNILCRRITWIEIVKKIKFVHILPHVWVDLDMAGEHLDIIRINNKNPENQRFYSLRVILSESFYNFIFWNIEFHAVGRIWTSDLERVWTLSKSSPKCPIPPWKVSKSSLNLVSKCTQQHKNL